MLVYHGHNIIVCIRYEAIIWLVADDWRCPVSKYTYLALETCSALLDWSVQQDAQ